MRRGYWENKIGKPHIVPCKVTDHCGSVLVLCLLPEALASSLILCQEAAAAADGCIDDCCTSTRGCIVALGNVDKATFDAVSKTHSYSTPDLLKETVFTVAV
ncbi:40S ribosomal protein S2 [Cricetulus griseus]|uniref:Small ribosomal subunit protein uS5 n=1 Tax=Cricetulus griseus TaxID=10029 RepID=G3HKG4_CRIGR|nr:40S ribosomal protein S2 [Cricetulus griseus]